MNKVCVTSCNHSHGRPIVRVTMSNVTVVQKLNNSAPHAVWNSHSRLARTHLICDFLPSAALLELLASGERDLGERRADVDEHLMNHRQPRAAAGG